MNSTLQHHDAEKGTLELTSPALPPVSVDITEKIAAPPTETAISVTLTKPTEKPKPSKPKVSKWIKWQLWFNTYRKFFTFIATLNMIGVIVTATGHFPYAARYTGQIVLGNFNVAILMRNELFGRFLYLFVNTLFAKWTPLWFRLACTSILQHLGGIHSGCAVSGFVWLIYRLTEVFINFELNGTPTKVFAVITIVLIAISMLAAIPWVRNTHHNVFERNHRFFGWAGLISTWIFVLLLDSYNIEEQRYEAVVGRGIYRDQQFWFILLMTIIVIIPWLTVRKVPVDIELPSPKVAVLRFHRGMQQGLLSRISRSAVTEYHAFGTISEGTHAKYHYLICGVQGDFTKSLVNDPPRAIWTRELKFAGVSNTSTLYTRGIRVCTGTGLGAALSTCIQSPNWYLIWIGSDQEKTFGPTISGLIHRHLGPERLCLWDSKQRGGRPDVMKLVREAYHSWKAEVVFITSNYQGNSEIMQGCKVEGIPAFGTLWDF